MDEGWLGPAGDVAFASEHEELDGGHSGRVDLVDGHLDDLGELPQLGEGK